MLECLRKRWVWLWVWPLGDREKTSRSIIHRENDNPLFDPLSFLFHFDIQDGGSDRTFLNAKESSVSPVSAFQVRLLFLKPKTSYLNIHDPRSPFPLKPNPTFPIPLRRILSIQRRFLPHGTRSSWSNIRLTRPGPFLRRIKMRSNLRSVAPLFGTPYCRLDGRYKIRWEGGISSISQV